MLKKNTNTKTMTEKWREAMLPCIDEMQLEMDKLRLSSDAHILWKKQK